MKRTPTIFNLLVLTLFVALGLTACAGSRDATAPATNFPWKVGWRVGTILEIDHKPDFTKEPYSDCRHRLTSTAANARFAMVEYSATHGRKQRHRIAVLPQNPEFKEGDLVYVNIQDCDQALVRYAPSPNNVP